MNRFDSVVEREMCDILDRITIKNDFWAVDKPIPEKIGFQRFGLQLREEDFKQDGVSYRDFFLRDRSEARKANSGFSVVKNGEKEFKVDLDVWPFQRNELVVIVVPGKHFTIKGEHEEKLEDNSQCARKFQRYYCLPKGSNSDSMKCSYSNGILTIRVDKEEVSNEAKVPQMVAIDLVTYLSNEGVRNEEQYTPVTDVREVPISSDIDPVAGATEPPNVLPVTKDNEPATEVPEPLKEVPVTNDNAPVTNAKKPSVTVPVTNDNAPVTDAKKPSVTVPVIDEDLKSDEEVDRAMEILKKATTG